RGRRGVDGGVRRTGGRLVVTRARGEQRRSNDRGGATEQEPAAIDRSRCHREARRSRGLQAEGRRTCGSEASRHGRGTVTAAASRVRHRGEGRAYRPRVTFEFSSVLWMHQGKAAWFFLTL